MCSSWQNRNFKELEDKFLGAIFLLASLPLMSLVVLLIKLTSPGPVLYIQKRDGLYGKRIRVYKFRTMHGRRRGDQSRLPPRRCRTFAGSGLPDLRRITPIGKLLRATSFDELPQLFNVLKGDMSLVGPRPHPVRLNRRYMNAVEQLPWRHCVKPGMTGLAQVRGARGPIRTTDDMRRRVEYDLEYISRWSPMLDLKIIGLTFIKGFIHRES